MPVTFQILPEHNLVYVRYDGFADLSQTIAVFADYARHPDHRPGQRQFVDLARVTGYERDFVKLMAVQARKAEDFAAPGQQTLIIYHAPTPEVQQFARLILRSWDGLSSVIALMIDDEAEALRLLGLQAETVAGLLPQAD